MGTGALILQGQSGRRVKVTIHLRLVPGLRIDGAVPYFLLGVKGTNLLLLEQGISFEISRNTTSMVGVLLYLFKVTTCFDPYFEPSSGHK